jgi:hypothetical protein
MQEQHSKQLGLYFPREKGKLGSSVVGGRLFLGTVVYQYSFTYGNKEIKIINQIKTKLEDAKAIVTKADKGNSIVIIHED